MAIQVLTLRVRVVRWRLRVARAVAAVAAAAYACGLLSDLRAAQLINGLAAFATRGVRFDVAG